jgi:superfamily I DNA/RNA helicase
LPDFIATEIKASGLVPRDISILVRMKAVDYMKTLEPAFQKRGVQLRNEAATVGKIALQELFTETLSDLVLKVLRLATAETGGRHWTDCVDAVCYLEGLALDDDDRRAKTMTALQAFCDDFAKRFPAPPQDTAVVEAVVDRTIDFLGKSRLLAIAPAYRQGDWYTRVREATVLHLQNSSEGATNWTAALDIYDGLHAIPLMTIHKSKGLEYHTVVFVGLDDRAWFNFARQSHEETAGLFVAFTRAKQRVIFTYCSSRGQRGGTAPLYKLLADAGVKTIEKG